MDILISVSNGKDRKVKENETFLIWNKKKPNTQLEKFKQIVEEKYGKKFETYWDLHEWSVTKFPDFWEEVWHFLGMMTTKPYDEVFVKTGPGFLDNDWFAGSTFNFAENILRIRDKREAIVYIDEEGACERVTFEELFEEVKLYSAALRKNGVVKGDRVACYMSNRKEAIYAMLAVTSIGAIWGGPQPYFGAKAAANIISRMDPKFLITEDRHFDSGVEHRPLESLSIIAEDSPTLEKIIILATKKETLTKDLSNIPNSCFLHDFLLSGRDPDGLVPDIVFEQLPFDHPVSISFSSGTTGLPKGPVHSAGSLIGPLMYLTLHWDLKSGDTAYTMFPNGWTLWNFFVTCLSLGVRLVLQSGNPFKNPDYNMWDIIADYKVTFTFLVTSIVDRIDKLNLTPRVNSNFEHLKAISVGGSPMKIQNFKYLQSIVKDHVYIGSLYGATETFSPFSGCDYNLPGYAPEIQVPTLGKDVKCYDQNGRSVIGQTGQMVVATPCPTLPLRLWKDDDNEVIKKAYFSKFPGVWTQGDACYINPETRGIVVKGRSDDIMIQYGERFGAADVYFAIHDMEEIQDYICVAQTRWDGESRAILFVKMKPGHEFTPYMRNKIAQKIDSELWADCVPELILEIKEVPYNNNNKRMESVVRKIVATNTVPKVMSVKNPECLKFYCDIPEIINFDNNNVENVSTTTIDRKVSL